MRQWAIVHGPIPGPRSQKLQTLRSDSITAAFQSAVPVVVERALGALLTDVDRNQFIDLASGVGALVVGHSHPAVVDAVASQMARVSHLNFSVVAAEGPLQLAARLVQRFPHGESARVAFFNSGAEAVENAVKIARAVTRRPAVIAFEGAFHGRTYLAMTLTSRVRPFKRGFGPFVPEIYRVPYPYPYRLPGVASPEDAAVYCLERLEWAFATQVDPGQVAAIVVEPVLGEGGFVPAPASFLQGLRAVADAHGILLVVDEIQTGFARTGRFLAVEHSDIVPDLITLGKGIAAGLPLSAVVGRAAILGAMEPGSIGGTYGGNPVACAAGLAVLDIVEQEDLAARAARLGALMHNRFEGWYEQFPFLGEVRGLGSMQAIEFVTDRQSRAPGADLLAEVARRAAAAGVITVSAGIYHNVLRMLPPLTIPEPMLEEALDIVEEALTATSQAGQSVGGSQ